MKQAHTVVFKNLALVPGLLLMLNSPISLLGQPTPRAAEAFNSYIRITESRLALQHGSRSAFLAPPSINPDQARLLLRQGSPVIENLTPEQAGIFPGALLHHWRGTAFVPGATAASFERLMRDFGSYPQHFAPQVIDARTVAQSGHQNNDQVRAQMRIRQHHVITVVLDTTYDITFAHLDAGHGFSLSRSDRIAEIEGLGTSAERSLNSSQDHGFLWRLNTYWSYEERDGGLYLQVEAVSLSRSIPTGLGWAVRPYIDSIPRESLEFTLSSTCNVLHR